MDTVPIYKVIVNPSNLEEIFICPKANTVLLLNLSGQIVHNYSNGKSTDGDFVSLTVSHRGQWVYCLCEDNILYCFNSKNQKLERTIK
ncbi:MAG: Serine/threonine-protein kinase smu1, partial [Paramarteilia canceri]